MQKIGIRMLYLIIQGSGEGEGEFAIDVGEGEVV